MPYYSAWVEISSEVQESKLRFLDIIEADNIAIAESEFAHKANQFALEDEGIREYGNVDVGQLPDDYFTQLAKQKVWK